MLIIDWPVIAPQSDCGGSRGARKEQLHGKSRDYEVTVCYLHVHICYLHVHVPISVRIKSRLG